MDASQTDDESLIGEACHIVAQSPSGPRGHSPLTPEQRDHYDNLILLCRNHHKRVDDQENTYTVQRLRDMKAAHEKWVRETLGPRPPVLPLISDLVPRRNPNFTGREDLLARLRQALTSGQPAALPQAIHGLGGVGKTQLAVEYAYRHADDYELVWWVRAEETAALAADYAALAGPLDLPEKDEPDQRLVVQAVRRWLGQHDGWLLVFDNARRPEDLRPYLPPGGAGHVLVTSRNPHWRALASPLTVQVMERPESVAFLLKRTGQTDEAAAGQLAEALGDLPLALAQAGAYVSQTGTTFPAYLDLFQSRRTELWEKERPPLDYPATVATTWDLAFQQVQRASPTGADLLNLCAFLAPDDIPQDLLRGGAQHLPLPLAEAVADPLKFDQAVAALLQYSLMERTGDALSVHRMVQAVARDRLAEGGRSTWAEAALHLVNDVFPSGDVPQDVRNWPQCARLLPHALIAAGHAEALEMASEATAHLFNEAGVYLWTRAEFAEAKAVLERALAIDEAAFGPEHPKVAIRVNNLGRVLQDLGDLDGARAYCERALAIDEAALGSHHPEVARDVNNLGSVLQDLGDLTGARAHYERALAIDEAAFGPHHPNVARDVNNLGMVLQDLGDLAGARAAYERAEASSEGAYGPQQRELGTVLCRSPKAASSMASARSCAARAPARSPRACSTPPRLLTSLATLGWWGPKAASSIASARL
jgi:tetratricopeptide (TPR) repeat protein